MAKKIKFPLEMDTGLKVRSLEELKENFNLEKVVAHFISGKLLIWLNDRDYKSEAMKVKDLDISSLDFKNRICEIFGIEFAEENNINIENIKKRNCKITKLKQFAENEDIIRNVDKVAFCQEELSELLDRNIDTIYLFSEEFNISVNKTDVKYIGIASPVLNIVSESDVDLVENNIIIENCILKSNNCININAENSKGITYESKSKTKKFNASDWKLYIKNARYYLDESMDNTDSGVELLLFPEEYKKDFNGKWYKNEKGLYKSRTDGSDEQLLLVDKSPVIDFCLEGDVIFCVTGFADTTLTINKIYRINLDGNKVIDMDIRCDSSSKKTIMCNKDYLLWVGVDGISYDKKLYKAKHDGSQKEILLYDFYSFQLDDAKITDRYFFYIENGIKNCYLYRIDLHTNEKEQIGSDIRKIDAYGDNLYYLKYENSGWGAYKNSSQNCFYKSDIDGKNKVLLDHHYPPYCERISRIKYANGILYYYTQKTEGLTYNSSSPEIENKIILNKLY